MGDLTRADTNQQVAALSVDNSGRGNCMYYAYSISLMYYLRAKNDHQITEKIFQRLNVQGDNKTNLQKLLNPSNNKAFTADENRTIEFILGPATRALAATSVLNTFLIDPYDSPLPAEVQYRIEYSFKKKLEEENNNISELLPENHFDDRNYIRAEIFQVDGMKEKIDAFVEGHYDSIKQSYKDFTATSPTNDEKENDKKLWLDYIIKQNAIMFLQGKNLNDYIQHLNTDYRWGTEDVLFALHRIVQNEQKHTTKKNGKEDTTFTYDPPITLAISQSNIIEKHELEKNPEMIINNLGNAHWTSFIPTTIFNPERPPQHENTVGEEYNENSCDTLNKPLHENNNPINSPNFNENSSSNEQNNNSEKPPINSLDYKKNEGISENNNTFSSDKPTITSNRFILFETLSKAEKDNQIANNLLDLDEYLMKGNSTKIKEQFDKICKIVCARRNRASALFFGKYSTDTQSAQYLIEVFSKNNTLLKALGITKEEMNINDLKQIIREKMLDAYTENTEKKIDSNPC